MDWSKSVVYSKTMWGLAVTFLGTLFPVLGIDISSADLATFGTHVATVLQDVMVYGGLIFAAYGRWKADTKLHVVPPVPNDPTQ